ncbi:TerB family tellurite resistance protein [Kiloniella laminariae]|uniref:TerB family tellurite resistance protein n=1 Tax=Kiloniella laminariae TaxID=454162 RepID=UPI00035D0D2E|nr:TerB family tellurite resistance protein [Kiloniella laminariae]
MSIWGKIVGGAAGFAFGGPIGAFLGALAGHAVDRMRAESESGPDGIKDDGTKQIAFTIGVIVLGAKMAKADGVVTKDEVAAFKQVFRIPPEEMKNVGRLFDRARQDAGGFEPYAEQLSRTFRNNPAVLEELLNGLFHIAKADGTVSPEEIQYLRSVAEIFGFSEQQWDRVNASNVGADKSDPYRILGVQRSDSDAEIKTAHRRLVLENHPDRLVAQGMPQEFVDLANEKLAAINAAYDQIKQLRK